ncbi:sugar-transfer associated ATP-grasp domain-containing protein [Halomonas sp. CS7]|uniref:Sugar-transfer associated ATP-grasp domain-containing protein n=1 Tax=Halomonas pelophila TaxID=3151122 RepID=A0ABV1N9G7_9GAMM
MTLTLACRTAYLGYYLRRMNWPLLRRFMRHTRDTDHVGMARQSVVMVSDSLRYNISPLEWYQFGFAKLNPNEKATWAGTGTMYEFQKRVNPRDAREVLSDKRRFHAAYQEFFRHGLWSIEALQADPVLVERLLADHQRLVFKDASGNCGSSVKIHRTDELSAAHLVTWMKQQGLNIVESLVDQHSELQALSPSGVNTVRIFTLIDEAGNYHVLGCRLRISVNSHVDNLAAGNLAAPIDEATGRVNGPGIYSDITRAPEAVHPVTGIPIEGFQVPYWSETLSMIRKASLKHPHNRSIGWDVVITPQGPGLIEGNHDWCKLVWQLPVRRGLKAMLEVT